MQTIITKRLVGWCPFNDTVTAKTFGELVQLAMPILTHYHSDLWRDATWLDRNLREIAEGVFHFNCFYYAVAPWGTSIGTDASCVKLRLDGDGSRMFEVHVYCDDADGHNDGQWHLEVIDFTDEA